MSRKSLAALVLAMGIAATAHADSKKPGLFDIGGWKAPVTRQRDAAKEIAPAALDQTRVSGVPKETRAVRLRIYADSEYRATVLRWQTKIRAQIERLNQIVTPLFNVRLEVESLREWNRTRTREELAAAVAELEAADPGTEVDWVLGLVTPFRGVATNVHQIGNARFLSRHMVLRGMDDEQEGRQLDNELGMLSPDERGRLYADRRAHKELVILLHEWAHTMGVMHSEDRSLIMNPNYDNKQAGFSDFQKEMIATVLDRRLGNRSQLYPESADLLRLLEAQTPEPGTGTDHAALLVLLRGRVESKVAQAAGEASAAFVEAFNKVVAVANAGRRVEAWALLAPLIAAAGKPGDGGATNTTIDGKTWLHLAELANNIGALTAAEAAAERVGRKDPEAAKVLAKADTNRRRVALPRDPAKAVVPSDKEPAYVSAFWEMSELVATGDLKVARTRLAEMAALYPGAVGVDVLSCELELRAKQVASALRRCDAALAKFDEATRAHFLSGFIAARSNRGTAAEKHFRQAILLDPGEPGPWRELARYYKSTRAAQRLSELSAQHQAAFSKPLPE